MEERREAPPQYTQGEVDILVKLAQMEVRLITIEENGKKYVSMEVFEPIRRIVYGMIGIILIAFIGALLTLVFIK